MSKKINKKNNLLQFQIKENESLSTDKDNDIDLVNNHNDKSTRSKNSNTSSYLNNFNIINTNNESNSLFSRNEEKFANDSLWIFSSQNKFRIFIQKLVSLKLFHKIIHIIILINCVFLIFETIPKLKSINTYSNYVFTAIFTLECILKIIAYGFILEDNTYLRDPWNWLDFIVVITGLLSYFPSISANLLALRTFRLIRPLRAMSSLPRMRVFVSTLISSIIDLTNVFLLLLFFMILFGILGLSLWNEQFNYRCRVSKVPSNGNFPIVDSFEDQLCGGEIKCDNCLSSWDFYPNDLSMSYIKNEKNREAFNYGLTNFDNIQNSLFVVFITTTTEGWTKVMNLMMNGYNYYVSFIFFVLCVVINYFFMLNLTVAVLLYNLEQSREHELSMINEAIDKDTKKGKTRTKNRKAKRELKYIGIKMQNLKQETEKKKYRREYTPIKSVQRKEEIQNLSNVVHRLKKTQCIEYVKRDSNYHNCFFPGYAAYFIYRQPIIQYFFYFCIIINAIFLMMERVDMSNAESKFLENANNVLVGIFTFEIFIAILGLGLRFFKDPMNIWDFIVVSFSLVEIILKETKSKNVTSSNASVANIFRTLRILRIFKLFPQWQNFHIILESIWETCVNMVDYLLLFILFLYMYALIGCSFFQNSMTDKDFSFKNFPQSLLTVFYIIIGDHWNDIYYNTYNDSNNNKVVCIIYFVTLVLFGHVTMVNIFLAYLIENFETAKKKLEKNITVKNFILNVMYYCSKAHEIQLKSERSKKRYKDRSMVTMLNKVLQRMFNKKLLSEGEFKITNKIRIDFNRMKPIQIEKYEMGTSDKNNANLNPNVKVSFFFDSKKNEMIEMFSCREDDFYEFDIDYYDDNIINVNVIKKTEDDDNFEEETFEQKKKRARSCYNKNKIHQMKTKVISPSHIGLESIDERKEYPHSQKHNILENIDSHAKKNVMKSNDFNNSLNSGENLLFNNNISQRGSDAILNKNNAHTLFKKERGSVGESEEGFVTPKENIPRTKSVFITNSKKLDIFSFSKEAKTLKNNNVPSVKKKNVKIEKKSKPICINTHECFEYMRNSSLFMFHIKSSFRMFIRKLVRHKIFNYIIILLIIGNIVVLAFDNAWLKPGTRSEKWVTKLNLVFNILFIIEGVLKIISDDFIWHSKYEISSLNSASTLTSLKSKMSFQVDSDSLSEGNTLNLSSVLTTNGNNLATNPNINEEKEQYIAALIKAVNSQKAYILDPVNFIDFVCIVIGIIDIINSSKANKIRFLKTLRVIRSIKPIRLLVKSENLNLMVNCLLSSLPAIGSVMIVCGLFIIIFALLGVNIFKDKLRYVCTNEYYTTEEDCKLAGFNWVYNYENFGNFAIALKTNFEVMMAEDWGRILQTARKRLKSYWVLFYYLIYVIVGHLFILNLFVSVVVQRFKKLKKHEKKFQHLSDEEKEWIHAQKIMLKFRPIRQYNMLGSDGKPIHKMSKCYLFWEKIVLSPLFEKVIMILISLSLITLVIQYAGSTKKYDDTLEIINYVFTFLFNIELILKLYVIRRAYFCSAWNRFDMIIILLCDIMVVINILTYCNVFSVHSLSALPIILRSFRILRIFRLLSVFSRLRALIDTLLYLIPSITNVGILVLLLIMVYANVGMGMFATVPYRTMINPNLNFRNFLSSVLLLFQVTTGEDWNRIMNELAYHDCRNASSIEYQQDYYCVEYDILCYDESMVNYTSMNDNNMFGCGSNFSYYYFITFVIFGPVFIMNLCIVMVIEGFGESMYENDGMLTQDYMDKFVSVWMKYDPECTKLVRPHEFVLILKELQPPIGLNYDRYFVNDPMKMKTEREKVVFLRNIIAKAEKEKEENDSDIYMDNYQDDFLKFPSFYEFKNFYFSSNKKFHTTDVEVMKIVDKLSITATTLPKNQKSKRAYSYTLTNRDNKDDKDSNSEKGKEVCKEKHKNQITVNTKTYIHFVDACLAVSRFAVCKTQNIAMDKLRPNIVNSYTKKMWTSQYGGDREMIKTFFDSKKKSESPLLGEVMAAKIMYDGVLKAWVERARKRIRERKEKEFNELFSNKSGESSHIIYNNEENAIDNRSEEHKSEVKVINTNEHDKEEIVNDLKKKYVQFKFTRTLEEDEIPKTPKSIDSNSEIIDNDDCYL